MVLPSLRAVLKTAVGPKGTLVQTPKDLSKHENQCGDIWEGLEEESGGRRGTENVLKEPSRRTGKGFPPGALCYKFLWISPITATPGATLKCLPRHQTP